MQSGNSTARLDEPHDRCLKRRIAVVLLISTFVLAASCQNQSKSATSPQTDYQSGTLVSDSVAADGSRELLRCSILLKSGRRHAVTSPLRVGEEFRLVFEGSPGTHVYVIAPSGLDEQPTVLLNGNPPLGRGIRSNVIPPNEQLVFPSRKGSWLVLGRRSRVTTVTILLSNSSLDEVDGLDTNSPSGLSDLQWCEIEKRSRQARLGIDVVGQPDGSCVVTCIGASCAEGVISFELALEVKLPVTTAHFDFGYANPQESGLRIRTTGEMS